MQPVYQYFIHHPESAKILMLLKLPKANDKHSKPHESKDNCIAHETEKPKSGSRTAPHTHRYHPSVLTFHTPWLLRPGPSVAIPAGVCKMADEDLGGLMGFRAGGSSPFFFCRVLDCTMSRWIVFLSAPEAIRPTESDTF